MFCGFIPLLVSVILRQRTDVGAAKLAWGVAWHFGCKTLPVEKSSEFKFSKYGGPSAKNQNSATAANWFGCIGCRWIRQRPYFPSGYVPLDLRDHMLSQKLLVDVGVGTFTGKNQYRQHKSAAKSACPASFRPLAITSGSGHHLGDFHLKNAAPTDTGGQADLHERSVLGKNFKRWVGGQRYNIIVDSPPAPSYVKCRLASRLADFTNLSLTDPHRRWQRARNKQSTIHCPTLYIQKEYNRVLYHWKRYKEEKIEIVDLLIYKLYYLMLVFTNIPPSPQPILGFLTKCRFTKILQNWLGNDFRVWQK